MTSTFKAPFDKAPSSTLWTSSTAMAATGGKAAGSWFATGISIDSRTVKPGDLFIALRGDQFDGHNYVVEALKKGAAAAMVSRPVDGVSEEFVLIVDDVQRALEALGAASRQRTGAKIIAVTGSVGKTGTKEMLGRVFSIKGQTHWSQKSFNNHIGVPLTLALMHEGTDTGIFELGMNHAGEMLGLSKQVKPDIAIITTVADVHIENFPDEGIKGVAKAKAEIFAGMEKNGAVILNRDNEMFDVLLGEARKAGLSTVLTFGTDQRCDAVMQDCIVASNGVRFTASVMGENVTVTLRDSGRHQAMNALAVLIAARLSGIDLQEAAKALHDHELPAGRGRREYLDIGDPNNPVMLIDESYNASPIAMQAAFKVLALIDPGRGGRRIAVLGDMLELGPDAARLHAELALPLKAANVDLLYTSGSMMKNLADAVPPEMRGAHRSNSVELAQIVPDVLVPGDVVMVKGSAGSKMGTVVEALRALPAKRKAANVI